MGTAGPRGSRVGTVLESGLHGLRAQGSPESPSGHRRDLVTVLPDTRGWGRGGPQCVPTAAQGDKGERERAAVLGTGENPPPSPAEGPLKSRHTPSLTAHPAARAPPDPQGRSRDTRPHTPTPVAACLVSATRPLPDLGPCTRQDSGSPPGSRNRTRFPHGEETRSRTPHQVQYKRPRSNRRPSSPHTGGQGSGPSPERRRTLQ